MLTEVIATIVGAILGAIGMLAVEAWKNRREAHTLSEDRHLDALLHVHRARHELVTALFRVAHADQVTSEMRGEVESLYSNLLWAVERHERLTGSCADLRSAAKRFRSRILDQLGSVSGHAMAARIRKTADEFHAAAGSCPAS